MNNKNQSINKNLHEKEKSSKYLDLPIPVFVITLFQASITVYRDAADRMIAGDTRRLRLLGCATLAPKESRPSATARPDF